jgi:hypothetical protein
LIGDDARTVQLQILRLKNYSAFVNKKENELEENELDREARMQYDHQKSGIGRLMVYLDGLLSPSGGTPRPGSWIRFNQEVEKPRSRLSQEAANADRAGLVSHDFDADRVIQR